MLSVIGLAATFIIVNTFVRNEVYSNIITSVQNNMTTYTAEVDGWFTNSLRILDTMAAAFEDLGDEYIMTFSVESAGWTLVSVFPVSVTEGPIRAVIILTLVTFAVILIIVIVLIVFLLSKQVIKPLGILDKRMQTTTQRGDITLSQESKLELEKHASRRDEIGMLFSSFSSMVEWLNEMSDEIRQVAGGDFNVDVNVRSEDDVISKSLCKMVDDLSSMFGDIQDSTRQVAMGSKQIVDGSQALAQGSAEQTASVDQLSSSIAEIAQATKTNSEMAERAAALAHNIKASAEKGNSQMDEMMAAVKDINESSRNISKVIKSIDDIAFQTNILALNAAVEAARAGQHGKGFAVVAEEVRNLAAKSAEAAKDTESLISDSIAKAELGSKIADETSASLGEIVTGIGESSKLVSDIAKSSEEQTVGIEQINTGINQVTNVTHQNNATATQSATASQEMNEQSIVLEQLISRFKLKESSQSFGKLPPGPQNLPAHTTATDDSEVHINLNEPDTFGKY
ncbi:MAG: methyl-accepting chemotaxis protein [Oscillospiraceae bacterium]|nr:methyl-accepting chemotaxis protein [Oscillospiraceae bacterium]